MTRGSLKGGSWRARSLMSFALECRFYRTHLIIYYRTDGHWKTRLLTFPHFLQKLLGHSNPSKPPS